MVADHAKANHRADVEKIIAIEFGNLDMLLNFKSLVFRFFMFLFVSLLPISSHACSCIGFSYIDHIKTSNAILKGQVESLSKEKYLTVANVKVIQVYKGIVNEKIVSVKYDGGAQCGASYSVGEISTFIATYENHVLSTFGCIKPTYQVLPLLQPVLDAYFYKVKKLSSEMSQVNPSISKLEKLLRIQEDAGDYLQSLQTAQRLLALNPNNSDYLLSVAKAKAKLLNTNEAYTEEANTIYKQLLEKNPNHSITMKAQFELLAKLKRAGEFKGNLKDFSDLELYDLNFSEQDLSGANFSNAKLDKINFQRSRLGNANFSNSKISSSNFQYARLEKSNFNNTYIYDVDFTNSNLRKSDFRKAYIINSKLLNGNFKKIKYESLKIVGNPNVAGSEFSPYQLYLGDNL